MGIQWKSINDIKSFNDNRDKCIHYRKNILVSLSDLIQNLKRLIFMIIACIYVTIYVHLT